MHERDFQTAPCSRYGGEHACQAAADYTEIDLVEYRLEGFRMFHITPFNEYAKNVVPFPAIKSTTAFQITGFQIPKYGSIPRQFHSQIKCEYKFLQ
jgi:hypothetical protein